MKIRGIIHTSRLKKFISLLSSVEDILIKEGFQHIIEIQTQVELIELLMNAVIYPLYYIKLYHSNKYYL